jgi:diguanylate cyclase (GGDEF)-like protein/PAS domain S-box-containing protein
MERRRGRNDRGESVEDTINVLLIDDNDEDRARIVRVVTTDVAPVELLEVSDHVGFYQALQENRFQLVITEQDLHWSSGQEVVTAVKSLRPGVPVIMVTRSDDDVAAAAAMREGVESYLLKTGDLEARLRTSLRSALRRLEFEARIGSLEGRLQDLLERLQVGVFRTAMDGTLLDTNTSFEKLVGQPGAGSETQRKLVDFFAEPAVYKELTDRLLEEGRVRSFQARWIRTDGSPIWVTLSQTIERRSEGGRVIEGLAEDVTAIRKAQEAILKAGDDLRAVLEHSGAAIAVLDADGTVAMVNSAFERFSGFARTEVEGSSQWSQFMPIADAERAAERRRVLLAAPESGPRSGRFDFVTRDGRVCRASVAEAVLPGGERTVVSLVNISERQRVEDRLMFNAFHDGLTGLPNRLSLMDRVESLLNPPPKVRRRGTALILLDVDRFKTVNDRFGPRIGDLLLRSVNRRIEGAVTEIDTMARVGSDSFAVVLHPVDTREEAEAAAETINEALEAPFTFGDHKVHCTASLGVAMTLEGDDAASLFRDAETAMYEAREAGGARWQWFDESQG